MWVCEDCDWEGPRPNWAQKEVEKYQSFIEVPFCPRCKSYSVVEVPTLE